MEELFIWAWKNSLVHCGRSIWEQYAIHILADEETEPDRLVRRHLKDFLHEPSCTPARPHPLKVPRIHK